MFQHLTTIILSLLKEDPIVWPNLVREFEEDLSSAPDKAKLTITWYIASRSDAISDFSTIREEWIRNNIHDVVTHIITELRQKIPFVSRAPIKSAAWKYLAIDCYMKMFRYDDVLDNTTPIGGLYWMTRYSSDVEPIPFMVKPNQEIYIGALRYLVDVTPDYVIEDDFTLKLPAFTLATAIAYGVLFARAFYRLVGPPTRRQFSATLDMMMKP